MSDETPHGQNRYIEKVQVNTPLLVPSFSTRGFPLIGDIYATMKSRLFGVCLVSALDLSRSNVPQSVTDDVNLVFLDSGQYEARNWSTTNEESRSGDEAIDWKREEYRAIARGIGEVNNVVLVNYDLNNGLMQQIDEAKEDFSSAPHAACDFLAKPESPARLLNIARLAKYAKGLSEFDIVGLTAREAGESLVERCRTLVMLRNALSDVGLDSPIHVFGAISPLEVMTYFLCGADVFDGLNWLRLSFRDQASVPIEESAFESGKAILNDTELLVEEWTENLSYLYRLQSSLQRYCGNHDLRQLTEDFPAAFKAVQLAEIAGAAIASP